MFSGTSTSHFRVSFVPADGGINRAHRLGTRDPEKVPRCSVSEVQPEPYQEVWEYLREVLDEPQAVCGTLARAVVGGINRSSALTFKFDGHVPAPVGRHPGSSWCTG